MSGNPFRHSQFLQRGAAVAQTPTTPSSSFLHTDSSSTDGAVRENDSGSASPPPPRTKKSVRIESPTSSTPHPALHDAPDPAPHYITPNRGKHAGSPPPSLASFTDEFGDQTRADGDDAYGERDMTGNTPRKPDMEAPMQSHSGAPANPFSRTLAMIEPQEKGGAELAHAAGHNTDRTAAEKPGPGPPKTNLDVEAFKRLLMTGISSSPGSTQTPPTTAMATAPVAPPAFESSSTDTSSVSRQSIFEPAALEPHVETPRTSYEMPSDDDMAKLAAEAKKEKRKPPPAPKHRHGKMVTPRTPQVVSFSEFEAVESTSPSPARSRGDSDLNKPLPPTPLIGSPQAHIISQDLSQDPPEEMKTSEASGHSNTPSPQKRVPPPVPLARRQSQLRTATGDRSRSSSNLTSSPRQSISEFSISEIPISESPEIIPGTTNEPTSFPSQQKATPPPPPPARRHHGSSLTSTAPSNNSSTTELPSTASAHRIYTSSLNPPSSHISMLSSPPPSPVPGQAGLARAASMPLPRNSRNPNPRSVSSESATLAPPPPPPRRRQSGRSSLDKERPHSHHHASASSPTESRRTSLENKRSSYDGKRRTSIASESSLRYEYAPAVESGGEPVLFSPKEEVDEQASEPRGGETAGVMAANTAAKRGSTAILDDMEKFQREIDELRERYQKGS